MGSLVWVGFIAFFFVALAVGVRLIALWTRTRELPELLIGIGVLGIGPVGFGAVVAAGSLWETRPALAEALSVVGVLAVMSGVFAKCVFNWRVYHPRSGLVKGIVALVGLTLAALFGYRLVAAGFGPRNPSNPEQLAQSGVQAACLLWGAAEAFRYWVMMRRRTRVGLADPVVANRFLCWGIGAGAAGLGTAIGTVASVITGAASMEMPWVVASSSAHGFVAAVAIFFAFLPPGWYVETLRAGTGAAPAA